MDTYYLSIHCFLHFLNCTYICIYKLPFFIRFVASLQYPPACYLFRACKTMANCGEDCEYSLTGGQPFLPQANCGDDCEYSLTGGQPFLTKVTYGDDSEYSLTGGQPFLQYCTYDQLWGWLWILTNRWAAFYKCGWFLGRMVNITITCKKI